MLYVTTGINESKSEETIINIIFINFTVPRHLEYRKHEISYQIRKGDTQTQKAFP